MFAPCHLPNNKGPITRDHKIVGIVLSALNFSMQRAHLHRWPENDIIIGSYDPVIYLTQIYTGPVLLAVSFCTLVLFNNDCTNYGICKYHWGLRQLTVLSKTWLLCVCPQWLHMMYDYTGSLVSSYRYSVQEMDLISSMGQSSRKRNVYKMLGAEVS